MEEQRLRSMFSGDSEIWDWECVYVVVGAIDQQLQRPEVNIKAAVISTVEDQSNGKEREYACGAGWWRLFRDWKGDNELDCHLSSNKSK